MRPPGYVLTAAAAVLLATGCSPGYRHVPAAGSPATTPPAAPAVMPAAAVGPAPDAPAATGPVLTQAQVRAETARACAGHGGNAMPSVTWRAAVDADKVILRPGFPTRFYLFVERGRPPVGMTVRVSVTDPAGGVRTATKRIAADRRSQPATLWADAWYPFDFPGADTSRVGAYRVEWRTAAGGPLACAGLYLGRRTANPRPATRPALDGDIDGDGYRDLVETLTAKRDLANVTARVEVRADLTAIGVIRIVYDKDDVCCGQHPGLRIVGVADLDGDGYGEVVVANDPPGRLADGTHKFLRVDNANRLGPWLVRDSVGYAEGERPGWYGFGCAADPADRAKRLVYQTSVETAYRGDDGTYAGRRVLSRLDGPPQAAIFRAPFVRWPVTASPPPGFEPGFHCGAVHDP